MKRIESCETYNDLDRERKHNHMVLCFPAESKKAKAARKAKTVEEAAHAATAARKAKRVEEAARAAADHKRERKESKKAKAAQNANR